MSLARHRVQALGTGGLGVRLGENGESDQCPGVAPVSSCMMGLSIGMPTRPFPDKDLALSLPAGVSAPTP